VSLEIAKLNDSEVLKIYTRTRIQSSFSKQNMELFLVTKVRYSYSKAYDMMYSVIFYYNPM
jgi:hypothetical protein